MRPPKGFENEKYPLRHRLVHSFALNLNAVTKNTALLPIVMSSTDMASPDPETIVVNPHNTAMVEDTGPLVRQHSIIDRMTISLKFSMTQNCGPQHEIAGTYGANGQTAATFGGEDIPTFKFLWRPIFNVYPEKLDAADDDTGDTVATILALTKDVTNEDIVPVTTAKLITAGPAESSLPMSTVNDVQVKEDYNMTTDTTMEDHVFDEDLLQKALRRYTNKGALRSCLGRTRHVTLTRSRPYKNLYIDKFVPNAIRRVQPYGFFAIQIHLPIVTDPDQVFLTSTALTSTAGHLGVRMITNYHEWNVEHDQSMTPPS